jgi:hypothetical protein
VPELSVGIDQRGELSDPERALPSPAGTLSDISLRSNAAINLALLLALGVAAGLSVAAWRTGLVLYADGALFSFIIGVGDAWGLVWHIMPARIAVYLLSVLPAETAHRLGLPAPAAMRLYQASFLSFPFVGCAISWALLPREQRWQLVFPVLSILALALSGLGYPSETLLTLAAFWPALFGLRWASGRLGAAMITLLAIAIFLFSHPGMVLALPVLAAAVILRWRDGADARVRRSLLLLGLASLLLVGLWFWRFRIEMSDPGIIQSSQRMWSMSGLLQVVILQPDIAVILASLAWWAAIGWRQGRRVAWLAATAPPALALAFGLVHRQSVTPESHYYIRTALIFALPVLGILALRRGREAPSGGQTLSVVAAICFVQLVHNVNFIGAWCDYRDAVIASIAASPSRIVPLQDVQARLPHPAQRSLAWSWGQPYLSLTLPELSGDHALIADPAPESYSPFRCTQMPAIAARLDWVPLATASLLKDYVCARRPG